MVVCKKVERISVFLQQRIFLLLNQVANLQKATKDNEAVQGKIAEYESTIQTLQEELVQAKIQSGIKIALLGAGAKQDDLDYLIYKMEHDSDWKPYHQAE